MDNVSLWSESYDWLEIVYNLIVLVLPTLAALAATTAFGGSVIRSARWGWQTVRPVLDEPTDPVVVMIAERTGLKPEEVAKFIVSNFDQIVELLPEQKVVSTDATH